MAALPVDELFRRAERNFVGATWWMPYAATAQRLDRPSRVPHRLKPSVDIREFGCPPKEQDCATTTGGFVYDTVAEVLAALRHMLEEDLRLIWEQQLEIRDAKRRARDVERERKETETAQKRRPRSRPSKEETSLLPPARPPADPMPWDTCQRRWAMAVEVPTAHPTECHFCPEELPTEEFRHDHEREYHPSLYAAYADMAVPTYSHQRRFRAWLAEWRNLVWKNRRRQADVMAQRLQVIWEWYPEWAEAIVEGWRKTHGGLGPVAPSDLPRDFP